MKKLIALLLAAMLVFSLAACGANESKDTKKSADSGKTEGAGDNATEGATEADIKEPIAGGYTDADSIVITDEIRALVEKASAPLLGMEYEPIVYLSSQVVAGTNHLILCKVTGDSYGGNTFYSLVTIYEDLNGNAEITDEQESAKTAPAPYDEENPLAGAYGEPTSYEVTDEASAALEKACETLTGATYTPVAVLAIQVVAGYNYSLLCKVTPSTADPDADSHYAIVTVYADLDGGASITGVTNFGGEYAIDAEYGEDVPEPVEYAVSQAD